MPARKPGTVRVRILPSPGSAPGTAPLEVDVPVPEPSALRTMSADVMLPLTQPLILTPAMKRREQIERDIARHHGFTVPGIR